MSFERICFYINALSPHIPLWHWVIMLVIAFMLPLILNLNKKFSLYGVIVLGISLFLVLFLFDALALIRFDDPKPNSVDFDFDAEFHRLTEGNEEERMLMLFNIAVFFPLGFLLSECFVEVKQLNARNSIKYVLLFALGLSLSIELIQLIFKLGLFELTDIVLNTMGALGGAVFALSIRAIIRMLKNCRNR